MGKAVRVHFSVAVVLYDMEMQLPLVSLESGALESGGQGLVVTSAKGHLGGIFQSTFSQKLVGLVALLSTILALLPYSYGSKFI